MHYKRTCKRSQKRDAAESRLKTLQRRPAGTHTEHPQHPPGSPSVDCPPQLLVSSNGCSARVRGCSTLMKPRAIAGEILATQGHALGDCFEARRAHEVENKQVLPPLELQSTRGQNKRRNSVRAQLQLKSAPHARVTSPYAPDSGQPQHYQATIASTRKPSWC